MIFIINAQGTITAVSPSPVHQGSIGVNDIILVSPAHAERVTLNATLPNGTKINPIGMGLVYPSVIEGYTEGYYIYSTTLNESVTQYPGLLSLRFSLKLNEGGTLTTSTAVIPIMGGEGIVNPERIQNLEESADTTNIVKKINEIIDTFDTSIGETYLNSKSAVAGAQAAEGYQKQAQAWATGEKGDNPVEDWEQQYNNNAKYYAGRSENSAIESELWATGSHNDIIYTKVEQTKNNAKYYAQEAKRLLESIKIGYELSSNEIYLEYTLPNGETKRTYYTFEEFVKSKSLPDIIYGTNDKENDTYYFTDKGIYKYKSSFSDVLVMRTGAGGVYLPNESSRESDAARVSQLNKANESINDIRERVEYLESLSVRFVPYSDTVSVVDVSGEAQKYALVERLGGMSYVSRNAVKLSPTYGGASGITWWISDQSISLAGTAEETVIIALPAPSLEIGKTYYAYFDTPLYAAGSQKFALEYVYNSEDGIQMSERIDLADGVPFSVLGEVNIFNLIIEQGASYDEGVVISPRIVEYSGVRETNVTELVSKSASGETVATLDIPTSEIQARLAERSTFLKLGDGLNKDINNYINFETDTVHGYVARIVLDGSEIGWNAKTGYTGLTRFQINYSTIGIPPAWIKIGNGKQDTSVVTPAISDRYESVSAKDNNNGSKGIAFSLTTLFIYDPAFTNLEDWLAYLREKPLSIVYQVATPVSNTVSDLLGDAPGRIMVSAGGTIKLESEFNGAAPIDMSFVEWKGI